MGDGVAARPPRRSSAPGVAPIGRPGAGAEKHDRTILRGNANSENYDQLAAVEVCGLYNEPTVCDDEDP
jgi:hypothetical protein